MSDDDPTAEAEESWGARFSSMAVGETLTCSTAECVWVFTATPGDVDGITRLNQHLYVRYECPLYPEEVEPGSAMAGGKLAKALNLLALQRQRALPGHRVGLQPGGVNLEAAHWLAMLILRQQPGPTSAAEICALLDKQGDVDAPRRALSRHQVATKPWPRPSDVEQAFKSARRIDLVECDWRRHPWTWWMTDDGRALLAAGGLTDTPGNPPDPLRRS